VSALLWAVVLGQARQQSFGSRNALRRSGRPRIVGFYFSLPFSRSKAAWASVRKTSSLIVPSEAHRDPTAPAHALADARQRPPFVNFNPYVHAVGYNALEIGSRSSIAEQQRKRISGSNLILVDSFLGTLTSNTYQNGPCAVKSAPKGETTGGQMLKPQKSGTRSSGAMLFAGGCLAVALIMPGSPLAADRDSDRDEGGGRKCRGLRTEARFDRSAFPQPEVRRSHRGVLRTTLHARISTNEMLDQNAQPPETVEIHPPTFEGTIPGPTLSVEPGDKLNILLVNDLPANPTDERGSGNFFPHDEYTLNLHTHGLTVSPLGISDNIFREMRPGTANQIEINIPKDHPSGTYWYHTHKHGSVTFQFLGGMAGFLLVKGGDETLDSVPEVAAAKDVLMGFQVIRATNEGNVVFVNEKTQQFGTFPFIDFSTTPPTLPPIENQGIWSTYGIDGGVPLSPEGRYPGKPSLFSYTTNGVANPTLHMRPGELQRWRLLNATDGDNLQLVLVSTEEGKVGLGLNVVAMDAITVPKTYRLNPGDPLVIGPGQRMDVMVKAGQPGTYLLQTLDPNTGVVQASVSPYRDASFPDGIDPRARVARHSFDFPSPCPALGGSLSDCVSGQFAYPVTLATIVVSGEAKDMDLPADPLPTPQGLPSVATMLSRTPDAVRNVAFEICGDIPGTPQDPNLRPALQLPSCGWYFEKYGAAYWGGAPFYNLEMMRDSDDAGVPTGNTAMPLVNFKKEGLFDPTEPLFPDMIAGNYEEWTVYNRSFSDHPFHLHQNHVLITKINGITLPQPEWHDTLNVPGALCLKPSCPALQPTGPIDPEHKPVNINDSTPGSITFRTYFNPVTAGCFVMHCHTLNHEDIGMMQRVDILPAKGQSSGCVPESDHAGGIIERLIASKGRFQICNTPRQSRPISTSPTTATAEFLSIPAKQ
jgi:FtsP/CotA-like multicopper oxidase with cupredoxin domain